MSNYWINQAAQAPLSAWIFQVCGTTQKTKVHFELKTSEKSKDSAHNRQVVQVAFQASADGTLASMVRDRGFKSIKAMLYAGTGRPLDSGHGGSKATQIRQANDTVKALLQLTGSSDKVQGYQGGRIKHEQSPEQLAIAEQRIAQCLFDQKAPEILKEAHAMHRAWLKAQAPAKPKAPRTRAKKAPMKRKAS